MVAYSRDGRRIAFVSTHPGARGTDTLRLAVLSVSGDTLLSRSYTYAGLPVKQSDIDGIIAQMSQPRPRIGGGTMTTPPQYIDAMKDAIRKADIRAWPFARSVRFGFDGSIWLQQRRADADAVWIGLDARGTPFATLTMPAGHYFSTGSVSQVWTTSQDADGFPNATRWAIAK
jgi:hypothetical protein